jgi:hypothetical protein
MPEDSALTEAERAELQRLRAEVTTLRSQAQQAATAGSGRSVAVGRGARQRSRTIVATLLIVVACVASNWNR